MFFSETLRKLREERGLSQKQLGRLMFVNNSTIARWENGTRLPDAAMITRLAECLGADANALFQLVAQSEESPNIILVDDSKVILSEGVAVLEEAMPNATITGFIWPQEAIEYAKTNLIALAFLDIELGTASGLDLCRTLIEINPRTSRSSALASKATGFPIAHVSTLLATGITLDEIPYWRDGSLEKYTPSGDYVVVKFARWAFEKFPQAKDALGTQMKAVGEVMSIGKNFKEAFQYAIRSLEIGGSGPGLDAKLAALSMDQLREKIRTPNSKRFFVIYEFLRRGGTVDEVFAMSSITKYFIQQMAELAQFEGELQKFSFMSLPDDMLIAAKRDGFSDKYLAKLFSVSERMVRERRIKLGVNAAYCKVPVSGVENACYYYSTYQPVQDEVEVSANKKIMILGGGPNRIGQGIEFDYCCVHTAMALREAGYETIMVNCNPETVSTDYDTSDKLYFEPVTLEDVLQIYEAEKPLGVIVQFGGQTPLNLARGLKDAGCNVLGTSVDSIEAAEDRDQFHAIMDKLGIPMPESRMAADLAEALKAASEIGYPLMIRPSFVLGGRGMEVIYDEQMLREYVAMAVGVTPDRPLYLDRFLHHALECEADALSDGKDVFIPAVMQHIELAGVHSGDSACVLPPVSIPPMQRATILDYTRRIAQELKVVGLMNMQFAIEDGKVYVIEANPRASRTVPLVSKVCGTQMARLATRLMLGETIASLGLKEKRIPYYGVKEACLPFEKFPEVDPVLGPEMRSTGEVLGMANTFGLAYFKSQEAAGLPLPTEIGKVLFSLSDKAPDAAEAALRFADLGCTILATEGTAKFLESKGVPCERIAKIGEGRPNVIDVITNREVELIVNTPSGRRDARADDASIRKAAIKGRIPYLTTPAAALAAARGIRTARDGEGSVRSLQEYHATIR